MTGLTRIIILITGVLFATQYVAARDDDNVIITNSDKTYTLSAKNGKLASVKVVEQTTYLARRADETIPVVAFYNEDISIDKASAPGAKPIYRSWEDKDMFYTGSRICALPVSLKKDKPTKVVFEQTYRAPEQFCNILLIEPYFTSEATVTVIVPAVLADNIRLSLLNTPDGVALTTTTKTNGDIIYTLKETDRKAWHSQKLAPSADAIAPQIIVTGFFGDVNELYAFLRGKISEEAPSPEVSALAHQITDTISDDSRKAQAIAAWVQNNIRYIAVEHGEYGIRPDAAAQVLAKRFGDCKGSANLIRAMLMAIGIDGRFVWIGTRDNVAASWTEMPSLAAGNHMIAAAVLPDTTLFLDGTARFLPASVVPPGIAGQQCLVENGVRCVLDTVPAQLSGINSVDMNAVVEMRDNSLVGTFDITMTGIEKTAFLTSLAGIDASKRVALLKRYLAFDRNSSVIDNITFNEGAPDALSASVAYAESDPAAIRSLSGGKTYVSLRPLRVFDYPVFNVDERKLPISLRYCSDYNSTVTFTVPEGYSLGSLPEKAEIHTPWFSGEISYIYEENKVMCRAHISMTSDYVKTAEVAEWNNAVRQIQKAASAPIILKK